MLHGAGMEGLSVGNFCYPPQNPISLKWQKKNCNQTEQALPLFYKGSLHSSRSMLVLEFPVDTLNCSLKLSVMFPRYERVFFNITTFKIKILYQKY